MTMTFFIIIPVCAIIHWIAYIGAAISGENVIRAWLFCYPLMCLVTIGFYFLIVHILVASMKEGLYDLEKNPSPYKDIDNLINWKEDVDTEDDKGVKEEQTCFENFLDYFTGGDVSKGYTEQEIKYANVSNAAAIYKIKRSF